MADFLTDRLSKLPFSLPTGNAPQLTDLLKFLNIKGMKKFDKANEVVNAHVIYSMGAGLVPIPVIDMAAVTAVQLNMINKLCEIYNVEYSETAGKSLLAALSGSAAARLGAGAIKALVPGIGFLLGSVSMSILSGATTYAVGQVFISHFEANGTLDNLNMEVMRRLYEEQLEKGREFATKIQHEGFHFGGEEKHKPAEPATPPTPKSGAETDAIISRLEKLNDLKTKGIITEEEFNAKKISLLEQL